MRFAEVAAMDYQSGGRFGTKGLVFPRRRHLVSPPETGSFIGENRQFHQEKLRVSSGETKCFERENTLLQEGEHFVTCGKTNALLASSKKT